MANEMKSFDYSGNPNIGYNTPGQFRNKGVEWVELQGGQEVNRFYQMGSDDSFMVLVDPSRNIRTDRQVKNGMAAVGSTRTARTATSAYRGGV